MFNTGGINLTRPLTIKLQRTKKVIYRILTLVTKTVSKTRRAFSLNILAIVRSRIKTGVHVPVILELKNRTISRDYISQHNYIRIPLRMVPKFENQSKLLTSAKQWLP